jgi:hypothetical protein
MLLLLLNVNLEQDGVQTVHRHWTFDQLKHKEMK